MQNGQMVVCRNDAHLGSGLVDSVARRLRYGAAIHSVEFHAPPELLVHQASVPPIRAAIPSSFMRCAIRRRTSRYGSSSSNRIAMNSGSPSTSLTSTRPLGGGRALPSASAARGGQQGVQPDPRADPPARGEGAAEAAPPVPLSQAAGLPVSYTHLTLPTI